MGGTQTHSVNHALAEKELDSYVFGGKYRSPVMPTRLHPSDVEDFIRHRLDRTKSADAFRRSRRLVDYYELLSVRDHFEKMLNRSEHTSKELTQSILAIIILAELGEGRQRKNISEYFRYLAQHPLAPEIYSELVQALEVVGTDDDAKFLAGRITASQKSLEPRTLADAEAADEYQRIDDLLNDDLPRVMADRQLQDRIMKVAEPNTRIEGLCRIYLGLGENDNIELTWWSARRIRREARDGREPVVVMALRALEKEIEVSDLPGEEKAAYTTRAARAVRFLGGDLTPGEEKILRSGSSQNDVLDRQP
jgi:hypothetical protein